MDITTDRHGAFLEGLARTALEEITRHRGLVHTTGCTLDSSCKTSRAYIKGRTLVSWQVLRARDTVHRGSEPLPALAKQEAVLDRETHSG